MLWIGVSDATVGAQSSAGKHKNLERLDPRSASSHDHTHNPSCHGDLCVVLTDI